MEQSETRCDMSSTRGQNHSPNSLLNLLLFFSFDIWITRYSVFYILFLAGPTPLFLLLFSGNSTLYSIASSFLSRFLLFGFRSSLVGITTSPGKGDLKQIL